MDAYLSKANLTFANLTGSWLLYADLSHARLSGASLFHAKLSRADLWRADLEEADLRDASLFGAYLREANLRRANLRGADLRGAYLKGADLREAHLNNADLERANLTDCMVYGTSAWDIQLEGAIQDDLVITPPDQPTLTVDNLEVAQFIYLLLDNQKIREVIDTVTSRVVLILGRFTIERKEVLDAIKKKLRHQGYLPVLFDFKKPESRNLTETVRTLAHLSCFIIADITDPSSIPQELYAIAPTLAVPIQPIIEVSQREYSMFEDLKKTYHWVLPMYQYSDLPSLLTSLEEHLLDPAIQKAQELKKK